MCVFKFKHIFVNTSMKYIHLDLNLRVKYVCNSHSTYNYNANKNDLLCNI